MTDPMADPLARGLAFLAAVLGGYGAVLSTINAVWTWRDRSPHVQVRLRATINRAESDERLQLCIAAYNRGTKPVIVTGTGLVLPDKRLHWVLPLPGNPQGASDLLPATNRLQFVQPKVIAENLRRDGYSGTIQVRGFLKTAVDQWFHGGRIRLDVDAGVLLPRARQMIWTTDPLGDKMTHSTRGAHDDHRL